MRPALKQLLDLGLLRSCTKAGIAFAESTDELRCEDRSGLDAMFDHLQGVTRKVPVPRRMIRRLAGGLSKARTATVIAHLIRCLFYRKGEGINPVGCCKASWVAEVFGVTERSVFDARKFLVLELGWLLPEECSQHVLNRDGLWVAVNLDWGPEEQGAPAELSIAATVEVPAAADESSGPRPENAGHFAGPSTENKKPLRESNNQKPASRPAASGGPAGFQGSNSGEKKPDIRDIVPDDFRDRDRLMELHRQAVDAKFISTSEADRLAFLAAAAHAQAVGSKPCRLFAWMVRGKRFEFITQADEDAARSRLRPPMPYPRELPTPAPTHRPEETLSADALLARSVQAALARAGFRGDPLPLVRRERPEWTRERWDAAVAELNRPRPSVPSGLNPVLGILDRVLPGLRPEAE